MNARAGLAYGLEADAEWAATDNLLFTAGASWTHTEIRDPNLTTAVCAQCTVTNPDGRLATPSQRQSVPAGARLHAVTDGPLRHLRWRTAARSSPIPIGGCRATPTSSSTSRRSSTPTAITKAACRIGYVFPDKRFEVAALCPQHHQQAEPARRHRLRRQLTGFVSDPRVIGIELSAHVE